MIKIRRIDSWYSSRFYWLPHWNCYGVALNTRFYWVSWLGFSRSFRITW